MFPSYCGLGPNPFFCGQIIRQVFYTPEPPSEHIITRRRLPTPPPNIHERIIVIRPPRKIIHEVVEQPVCPPPIVKTNFVLGPKEPAQIISNTVNVCPSSTNLYSKNCEFPNEFN
ncbi:hypothetical protein GJ496_008352 [Pomphorhynchus laevis]|nr:hypothetical protein GJ496_008352 [Pomphorhynchus laevis]